MERRKDFFLAQQTKSQEILLQFFPLLLQIEQYQTIINIEPCLAEKKKEIENTF